MALPMDMVRQLITDRTKTDVLLGTEKGCYGVSDLKRVEGFVEYLLALMPQMDIHPQLQVKTDWTLPGHFDTNQWPTVGQMARYLHNVACLCDGLGVSVQLPASMEKLTWEGANQIEKALLAAYNRIDGVLQAFQFSGELFAGEENGI